MTMPLDRLLASSGRCRSAPPLRLMASRGLPRCKAGGGGGKRKANSERTPEPPHPAIRQPPPSVTGHPPNDEVDASHLYLYDLHVEREHEGSERLINAEFADAEQSSFPSAGGVSLEQLSVVTLSDLLTKPEKCVDCKVLLTVVQPAFATASI